MPAPRPPEITIRARPASHAMVRVDRAGGMVAMLFTAQVFAVRSNSQVSLCDPPLLEPPKKTALAPPSQESPQPVRPDGPDDDLSFQSPATRSHNHVSPE